MPIRLLPSRLALRHPSELALALGLAALVALTAPAWAQETAERIFTGGVVLTMNDAQPRAEAVRRWRWPTARSSPWERWTR